VTVIFAIICSIICSIKKEYFNIKNIRWKAELNHFFKLELSKKDLKTHTKLLFEFKNKRLVYNNSSIKFSYLDLTDIYHFITSKYYIYGHVSKELIDYVLKCEDKNGGFKNFPDGLTNLESAYYAINTLDLTTDLRKIDKRKHIVWICSFNIKEESLKDIYYAIASLNILNSTKDIRSLKLKQYIKEKYNFSQKDYSDTYFFLSSLNMLDSLSNDIKEKVINYWIPIHESIALNYRVDANYEELFYYLNILRILGITNKSLIPDKIKEALQTT